MNQRLINCDFLLKGGFDSQLSNKAKLLYFYLLINADDKGFVGNTNDIIEKLNKDLETGTMLEYNFNNASDELLERGLVYRFMDRHHNQTLLIRHWFMHNKYQKFLTTNFISYLAQVELIDNCYEMKNPYKGKEINKTNKLNEINENNISSHKEDSNDDTTNKDWQKDWDKFLTDINDTKESKDE